MAMNRKGLQRAVRMAACIALCMFAFACVALTPRAAYAAGDTFKYKAVPIDGVQASGNFEWRSADAANPPCYVVRNYQGWLEFAAASRAHDFDGYLIRLENDLDFAKFTFEGHDRHDLAVGNSDRPFRGTFDGMGHTISNLNNPRESIIAEADCGFFGWTRNAVVKNINFKNCYVGTSYRGGLVVGYANNTFLLNILCEDCTTSVVPGNNVINLVTNAGLAGGMIAGESSGSTLYNCEMRGGKVVCNATAGVAALGGQPLYIGGLLGDANDTVVEYCRVTSPVDEQGKVRRDKDGRPILPEVKNQYGNAVSVASYSEVFTGGIVGMIKGEQTGTKIVDCYSVADCYSEACLYFGVGLGLGVTEGYTGGIVGLVRDVGNGANEIRRVSYAGNLHSYTYNVVLLGIPAIEHDTHLGGIIGRGGNNAAYSDAYFKRSASSTSAYIPAIRTQITGDGIGEGADFGKRDDQYDDRSAWESWGFDMQGGTLRNVTYPWCDATRLGGWDDNHYNKWTMDHELGMPVHGGSIKATLDFPGSGAVSIAGTAFTNEQHNTEITTDPYSFAVQGFRMRDPHPTVTFEQTGAAPEHSSWANDPTNKGYRFEGWFRSRGVRVNGTDSNHAVFTEPNEQLNTRASGHGLLHDDNLVEAPTAASPYKLTLDYPKSDEAPRDHDYSDNDLYVAHAKAQVLLHDVNGDVIDSAGAPDAGSADAYWYGYGESVQLPAELAHPAGLSKTAKLIGWTTRPATGGAGVKVGYAAATSAQLAELKRDGVLWNPGAGYSVTEPANLYPVYADYISNVNVIYEGHERHATGKPDVVNMRPGFGEARVVSSLDGSLELQVIPEANSPVLDQSALRFLGWYENIGTEQAPRWVRVSKGVRTASDQLRAGEPCYQYKLQDLDLSRPRTYMARFEYRVTYYDNADSPNRPYAQPWMAYGASFLDYNALEPSALGVGNFTFNGWFAGKSATEQVGDAAGSFGINQQLTKTDTVRFPMNVHAQWGARGSNQTVDVWSDFPGSERETPEHPKGVWITGSGYDKDIHANWKDAYTFHFWDRSRHDGKVPSPFQSTENPWRISNFDFDAYFKVIAHATARVTFKQTTGVDDTVQRRYLQQILQKDASDETIKPYYGSNPDLQKVHTDGAAAAETNARENAPEGYVFLGWIEQPITAPEDHQTISPITQDEFDYVFEGGEDLGGGIKSVRSALRALPYLVDADDVCTRAMTLAPVYARVGIETTTSVAKLGQGGVTTKLNVPYDPTVHAFGAVQGKTQVHINYDHDGGRLPQGEKPEVTLGFDSEGVAKIKVAADITMPMTDDAGSPVYKLTGMTMRRLSDDYTVDLQLDAGSADTFTAAIRAGEGYEFVAKYQPIPVVYHVAPSNAQPPVEQFTQMVPRNEGEPLGAAPMTTQELDHEFGKDVDAADMSFHAGWTLDRPAQGDIATYVDGSKLVAPTTPVLAPMELWPVYRAANIKVTSNIESVLAAQNMRPRIERSGQSLKLVARVDVPGYSFKGWRLQDKPTADVVSGEARFAGATYTAIYEQVNQVRYHGYDGSVLFTASVPGSSDRTFVKQQEVQVPNGSGDGTHTEMREVPVDTEAFSAIMSELNDLSSASDAVFRLGFSTWVMRQGDRSVAWDDFKATPVNTLAGQSGGVIDLYPRVVRASAQDPSGALITSIFEWGAESSAPGSADQIMRLVMKKPYSQPWMSVDVQQVSRMPASAGQTGDVDVLNIDGQKVQVYERSDSKSAAAVGVTGEAGKLDVQVKRPGRAYLNFSGKLELTKETRDPDAAGKTFFVTIEPTIRNSRVNRLSVPIVLADRPNADGVYAGSVHVKLPFGTYRVSEDVDWHWRYSAAIEERDAAAGTWKPLKDATVAVKSGNGAGAQVRITNERGAGGKNQWIDGEQTKHNVFTKTRKDGER